RRHRPLLELVGARVEHPDAIAVVLAEPEAILAVHHAAARSGSRGWRFEDPDLAGLRVDAAHVPGAEDEEIAVVLRIGNDVVDVRPRNLVRLEHLEPAGRDVEPEHCVGARVLQPYLAVDMRPIRADLIYLHVRTIQPGRQAPRLKFLASTIEL